MVAVPRSRLALETTGTGSSIATGSKFFSVGGSDIPEYSNAYIGEILYYARAVGEARSAAINYLAARGSATESAALLDICFRLELAAEADHRAGKQMLGRLIIGLGLGLGLPTLGMHPRRYVIGPTDVPWGRTKGQRLLVPPLLPMVDSHRWPSRP